MNKTRTKNFQDDKIPSFKMKIYTYILFLLLFTNVGFAQQDSTSSKFNSLTIGINLGSIISVGTLSAAGYDKTELRMKHLWNYYTYLTFRKKNSFLALGPSIGSKLEYYDNSIYHIKSTLRINGFHVTYQHYTKPKKEWCDFFLQYHFSFISDNLHGFDFLGASYKPKVNYRRAIIENVIGCGINLKIFQNFHFNQTLGVGFGYEKERKISSGENPMSPGQIQYSDKSSQYFFPNISMRLGIGYSFDR